MRRTVLYVDHAPAIGGAEQSLLLLLRHLDRDQWEPHLACAGDQLAEGAAKLDIPVHRVEFPRLRRSARFAWDWTATARTLAGLALSIDAALLHANTVRSALYASPAARLAQRPFVWHMRDFWLSENRPDVLWLDRLGKQILCRSAHTVIANSHAVAQQLPCSARTAVIHNGIDIVNFDPSLSGKSFRQRCAIPAGAPLVGMVGRLRPWKGQEHFLRMAAAVAERHPSVRFVAVGGDPFAVDDGYAKSLERQRAELGLASRLAFTGHLDDVRPALAAMDVFVHPGDPEPFGLVNLEAMAVGKPVVAFAHGALPEIVVDGETGLLAAPGDANDLARRVSILLNEPSYAARLGEAGRRRTVERFDVRITTQHVERVYQRMV